MRHFCPYTRSYIWSSEALWRLKGEIELFSRQCHFSWSWCQRLQRLEMVRTIRRRVQKVELQRGDAAMAVQQFLAIWATLYHDQNYHIHLPTLGEIICWEDEEYSWYLLDLWQQCSQSFSWCSPRFQTKCLKTWLISNLGDRGAWERREVLRSLREFPVSISAASLVRCKGIPQPQPWSSLGNQQELSWSPLDYPVPTCGTNSETGHNIFLCRS